MATRNGLAFKSQVVRFSWALMLTNELAYVPLWIPDSKRKWCRGLQLYLSLQGNRSIRLPTDWLTDQPTAWLISRKRQKIEAKTTWQGTCTDREHSLLEWIATEGTQRNYGSRSYVKCGRIVFGDLEWIPFERVFRHRSHLYLNDNANNTSVATPLLVTTLPLSVCVNVSTCLSDYLPVCLSIVFVYMSGWLPISCSILFRHCKNCAGLIRSLQCLKL